MVSDALKKRCVCLDLDGTLIDSIPDIVRSLNFTLLKNGLSRVAEHEVKRRVGLGAHNLIKGILEDQCLRYENERVEQLKLAFLAHYAENPVENTRMYPGAKELLVFCREKQVVTLLCTNKPSTTTYPVLEHLNLNNEFDAVFCFDHVEFPKPDGRHIKDAVRSVGGDLSHTVMIGDTINDIEAAKDAGVPSIAVSYGYFIGSINSSGATSVANSLFDATRLINYLLL